MIQKAADLGGADFITALPYKFDTYTIRPVEEHGYGSSPSDSIFFGKEVDYSEFKLNDDQRNLSGGQQQRIAL
jgi:ABC-type multidrug transport system fused ATPase/permease subunit